MNDLTILHDAWAAPEAPSPTARAQARAALVARGAPRRRRALLPRLAAAAALACIAVTGLVALDGVGGGAAPVPEAAAAVLERAAAAAERRPFTPPRDDQWIYFEDRITPEAGGAAETRRTWRRADGGGMAWLDDGELHVAHLEASEGRPLRVAVGPLAGYRTLAALPTDPDALLRWAYREARDITGAGLTEHGDVYAVFSGMVRENVLPPELEAAIFRALKQVPGVTLETEDVAGRGALVLGQTEDWLREELLLDPETYAYRGERSTVTRDATIDPLKAGNPAGSIEKGQTVVVERVRTAIVDAPRP